MRSRGRLDARKLVASVPNAVRCLLQLRLLRLELDDRQPFLGSQGLEDLLKSMLLKPLNVIGELMTRSSMPEIEGLTSPSNRKPAGSLIRVNQGMDAGVCERTREKMRRTSP